MPYVSLDMRRAMLAEATGDVGVVLVTISHPDLEEPLRLSSDNAERFSVEPLVYGTRSNGADYLFALRGITLPDADYTGAGSGQLVIDDIDGRFERALRAVDGEVAVLFQIVRAAAPDEVEFVYGDMRVVQSAGVAGVLTLDLAYVDGDEPCPCDTMGKENCSGLFW
jgi:hypothetical protein